MLYEQGRVHHVNVHPELEDQMCTFVPASREGSPDRVDALVWAVTELMGGAPVTYFSDDDDWRAPSRTF
jgi:phage terminase large subunit-like protein